MAASIEQRNSMEKAAIDVMQQNMTLQNEPMLGIFWYDPKSDQLFGVTSSLASDIGWYHSPQFNTNVRTERRLHEAIWQRNYFRHKDPRFHGDYTQIPRGRVFEFQNEGFRVFTGSWINDYPQVKDMILDEFQLPPDTVFLQDIHWELGHGWSNELL